MALLLAVGVCGVRWLLLPRASGCSADELSSCEQRLAQVLLIAALTLTCTLLLRLAAHTTAVFGFAESLSIETIRVVAIESRWGSGWRLQVLGAIAVVATALSIKIQRKLGWLSATGSTILCCLAVPLLGHAAGEPRRVAFHTLHLLGGGVWVGSLAAILMIGGPRAALFQVFAPVALSCAAVLAASGGLMTLQYVVSLPNLWTTAYGRTLSIKLALVGTVAVCGFLNWRRWRSVASGGESGRGGGRLEMVEATLAVAVVLVTALLTELEHS